MRKKMLTLSMSAIVLFALLMLVSALTNHPEAPASAGDKTEYASPEPTEQEHTDEAPEQELPPLLIHQILDDTIPTPRYLLPWTDNALVNVLLYAVDWYSAAAIRESMNMFLSPELEPNQEWIEYVDGLYAALPPLGPNVMATPGIDGEPLFIDIVTGEIVEFTPLDPLIVGIYSVLVNPEFAETSPGLTDEAIMQGLGLSELPHFVSTNKLNDEIIGMVSDFQTPFPDIRSIIIDTAHMSTIDVLNRLFEYDIVEELMTYKRVSERYGFSYSSSNFADSFILEIERYFNPSVGRFPITNTQVYPYRTIAHLGIVFQNGVSSGGSGFLINRNTVVTAGHNIYDPRHGMRVWARLITTTPGLNGNQAPFPPIGITVQPNGNVFIPPEMLGPNHLNYDWGVKRVASVFNVPAPFPVMRAATNQQLVNFPHTIIGYPLDRTGRTMYLSWGQVTAASTHIISTNIHGYRGLSGAPLFDDRNMIVGIQYSAPHSGGNSTATRLRPQVIQAIANFSHSPLFEDEYFFQEIFRSLTH